jgi:dihydroorotase
VFEEIKKAADDGIIFDVGHGFGSFHWDIVTACLDQDLLPNTISTDLHLKNVHGPVYDMPTTMSKFLMLGLPLTQVFEMSTLAPAKVLGREAEIGTLKVGSRADVALFELNTGEFEFTDSYDQTRTGHEKLSAVGIVQRGQLHLNSNRMA